MIPVVQQKEPPEFDKKVRTAGREWLRKNRIAANHPPPKASALPAFWRGTQRDLWTAYGGVCAYLCIFFEWALGASSTDHFVAKSKNAGDAYEWSNYRLSCLGMNRNKGRFDDILDPCEIESDTFELDLLSGKIFPNISLPTALRTKAKRTIVRLGLDDPITSNMRAQHFGDYCQGEVSEKYLKRHSPFVWYEAKRQGLL